MTYFIENYGNNVPHAGCCGHPEADFLESMSRIAKACTIPTWPHP